MIATVHHLPAIGLEQHTKRVKQLMENFSTNTIELGVELKQARDKFPATSNNRNATRPGWHKWLNEVGVTVSQATNLIKVAERFGRAGARTKGIGRTILVLLSEHATPDAAIRDVVRRVRKGEKITEPKAKKIINKHRPKPAEANKIAKETGKAVLASDGYIYLGADKADVKEATAKRTVIFAIRSAIETLGAIELTPQQLLAMAAPHQLLHLNDGNQIPRAATWLVKFSRAWRTR